MEPCPIKKICKMCKRNCCDCVNPCDPGKDRMHNFVDNLTGETVYDFLSRIVICPNQ